MGYDQLLPREFREPGFRKYSAQFVGVLRRIAETVIFPCNMTNEYCINLRRRRIRANKCAKKYQILAREIPYRKTLLLLLVSLSLLLLLFLLLLLLLLLLGTMTIMNLLLLFYTV